MSSQPDTADASPKPPWPQIFLAASVAALHAVVVLGRIHPDELYQFIEPGHWRAFGYGILAWEWKVGLRNWAVPGLISYLLRFGAALGIRDPWAQRALLEVPQFFLHAAMLAAVWRFSARRVGPELARWCVWLVATYALVVWFGGRTMGESLSAALLVWGLERLDDPRGGAKAALLAGLLFGLAQVVRYGSAAIIAPAMVWLLVQRRWVSFAAAAGAGLVVAVALGWLDALTWGDWFHSLKEYFDFNIVKGQSAAQFGQSPWHTYLLQLQMAPFAAVGLLLWWKEKAWRAWLLVVPPVAYVVSISATPHKEPRFLYPALVLFTVAGAPAFVAWARSTFRPMSGPAWKRLLVVVAVGFNAVFFAVITPFDVQRPEQFQLAIVAGRTLEGKPPTGLLVMPEGVWGATGYFYWGHDLPWNVADNPGDGNFQGAMRDGRFNRLVTTGDRALEEAKAAGFRVYEERGPTKLLVR